MSDAATSAPSPEQASWNPALRPNSDQEVDHTETEDPVHDLAPHDASDNIQTHFESPSRSTKTQPRHFAQSASIHHLPDQEDSEFSPSQERSSFDELPKQGIDYTNSFPVVPDELQHDSPDQSLNAAPKPLPRSQAEDIEAESSFPLERSAHDNGSWGGDDDGFFDGSGADGGGDDFFGTGGHDQTTTVEDDPSFAEGLPLVEHGEPTTQVAEATTTWGDAAGDDDFFTSKDESTTANTGMLDRKSTSDVLDSMHYPPHAQTHDDDTSPGATNQTSLGGDVSSGDLVAVSATSVAEAVLGTGADLSAVWSEALGDDDLLEDDSNAVDPSAFFEDDGEGFLDELTDATNPISPSVPVPVVDPSGQLKGFSANAGSQKYAPSQTSAPYAPNAYNAPLPATTTSNLPFGAQPRPEPSKAQSFVDKAKGGYESPYDLPMDLRPNRRSAPRQQSAPSTHNSMPPPAALTLGSSSPQFAPNPKAPQGPSTASRPPAPSAKPSAFFEELPVVAKPSRPSSTARFSPAPQSNAPVGPPRAAQIPPPRPNAPSNPPTQTFDHGLVLPERQLSFGDGSEQQSAPSQAPPKPNNRYSPAPASQPTQPGAPPAQGRYSSAPAGAPPGPFQRTPSVGYVAPFQPRTSSPLARSTSVSEDNHAPQKSLSGSGHGLGLQRVVATPEMSPTYEGMMQSPEKVQSATRSSFGNGIAPDVSHASAGQQTGTVRRKRAQSSIKQYVVPSDARAQDPLERWKGGPIFKFSPGGVVSSFPVETPRFSVGQTQPLYVANPGEVKTRNAKQVTPLEISVAAFPGPLKNKSKKKELLAWLNKHVETLNSREINFNDSGTPVLDQSRHTERIILFRALAVLVENDGNLDAAPAVTAIRDILVPPPPSTDPQLGDVSYGSQYAHGITRSAQMQPKAHTTDVNDIEEVRKLLLKGEREKAAWLAVDKNLWGHAMLISSTIQGETWKQVVHEFVRNEVKGCGNNTEGISALYDVFSGNWDESVDQLVSSSARSGFHMVSKTGSTSSQNALAGLDRWQETLALILSNRTAGDARALLSLGELLATYGRAEASHLCYIIAKMPGTFSGADDPQARAVLIGANHRQRPFDLHKDTEAILASETYEFAVNVLAGGGSTIPLVHLAPFKLQHAYILAEGGHRDEAQQYCESITASLKANKMAPYLHAQLITQIDELVNRLSQAPREPSKSWLANPKMGNVSSSLLSSFNKFVSGDDSDNASTVSGPTGEPGPFGGISGEPISLSRSASPAMPGAGYNAQNGVTSAASTAGTTSRYAPGGSYSSSPSGSYTAGPQHRDSSGSLPRMSPDYFRKVPTANYQPQGAYTPTSGLSHAQSYSPEIPKSVPAVQARAADSSPLDSRPGTSDGPQTSTQRRSSYEPLSVAKSQRDRNSTAYQPRSNGLESRSSSYAPRSGSYAPRSYAPSPAASERLQRQVSGETNAAYVPQAPVPEEPAVAPTTEAAADEPPSTTEETQAEAEAPISFGYDPSPSYGYQAPPPAENEDTNGAMATQPEYGFQPADTSAGSLDANEGGSGGYEPPSYSSYQPASYQPYEPDANTDEPDSPVKTRKKGIMDLDDEDDFGGKAEQIKKEEKARKDREAEDAFKRAAEADAARDAKPAAGQKKGWFGGWLGGKKDQDKGLDQPAVHKAKLGEESSFVYDEDLKKWVNKKGGAEAATAKTATPPPPKAGPPMRTASAMGPPRGAIPTGLPGSSSMPPSRNVSPLVNMKSQDEATGASESEAGTPPMKATPAPGAPPQMGGGIAPSSRPSTGMSGASAASTGDDLLGSLGPRKGAAGRKGKKGGRYVDVMAK